MMRGVYLRRRIENTEIQFVDDEWRASFARHVALARRMPFYESRIEFAKLWMKEMQSQMRVFGILDPDTTFKRVIRMTGYRPQIDDIIFMRGLIGSHWRYGEYFVRYTSGKYDDNAADEVKELRNSYFLSAKDLRNR